MEPMMVCLDGDTRTFPAARIEPGMWNGALRPRFTHETMMALAAHMAGPEFEDLALVWECPGRWAVLDGDAVTYLEPDGHGHYAPGDCAWLWIEAYPES